MRDSAWVFFVAAAAILAWQLILPPVTGLADNGDFGKVIGRFGLEAPVHRTYEYADTVYFFHPEHRWVSGFRSAEIPLAQAAIWLNALLSKDGSFDLRAIGIVHAALFLWALWLFAQLLAPAPRFVRWMVLVLTLLIFCDMMYVVPLNSFYMDEAAYLFLLLTAVLLLRVMKWHRRVDAVLLLLCASLLTASKGQHAMLGFWIAIVFLVCANSLGPMRPVYWRSAAGGLVLLAVLVLWKGHPAEYPLYSLYNVTFERVLPHQRDASAALRELGLDDSYRLCIGKKAYLPGSGMDDAAFVERFGRRYSFGRLALFYARHPNEAYWTLRYGLSEAGRQHDFGNFDIATGYKPFTQSRAFTIWSDCKRHVFEKRGSVMVFAFLGFGMLLCVLLRVKSPRLPGGAIAAGLCLIASAVTEMLVATMGDSMDTTRHAMLFFALFDMIVLGCVWLAADAAYTGWSEHFRRPLVHAARLQPLGFGAPARSRG